MVLELQRRKIIPDDLRIRIIPIAICTFTPEFGTGSTMLLTSSRRRWWGLLFVAVLFKLLPQSSDKAIDFVLGFEKAFSDVVTDDWKIVCSIVNTGRRTDTSPSNRQ